MQGNIDLFDSGSFFGYGQGGIFLAIERAVLRCVGVIIEFRGAVEVLSSILGLFVK